MRCQPTMCGRASRSPWAGSWLKIPSSSVTRHAAARPVLARLPVRGQLRTLNLLPQGAPTKRFVARLLGTFGGVGSRGNDQVAANVQRLALLARSPGFLFDLVRHVGHVRRTAGLGRLAISQALLAAVRNHNLATLNIIQHNFMDAETVQSGDTITEERLAGCSFRGAAKRNGDWVAVPMCEINSGPREELYALEIQRTRSAEIPLHAT